MAHRILLLGMVYYMSGAALEDPAAGWSGGAIAMIVVTFAAVFIYDALWSSPLASNLRAAVITSYVLVAIVVAAYVYVGHFSQRGTLIHTACCSEAPWLSTCGSASGTPSRRSLPL
jgi:uncharacterized membrane protein